MVFCTVGYSTIQLAIEHAIWDAIEIVTIVPLSNMDTFSYLFTFVALPIATLWSRYMQYTHTWKFSLYNYYLVICLPCKGASAVVVTSVTVAVDVTAGTDVMVGIDVTAGTDVTVGTDVTAGTDVMAGTDVTVGTDVTADTDVTVGTDVTAGTDVTVGTDVTGDIDVTAGTDVTGDIDVMAGTDVTVGTDVIIGVDDTVRATKMHMPTYYGYVLSLQGDNGSSSNDSWYSVTKMRICTFKTS